MHFNFVYHEIVRRVECARKTFSEHRVTRGGSWIIRFIHGLDWTKLNRIGLDWAKSLTNVFASRQHTLLCRCPVSAMAEASVCLCVCLSVRPSVTLLYSVKTTQAKITRSLPPTP